MSAQDAHKHLHDPLAALRTLLPAAAFSDAELREMVPLCGILCCASGTTLMTEGEPSDNRVFFLLEGSVSVSMGGRFILRLQNPGDTVGEMGLISAAPRSATVSTDVPSTFLVVHAALGEDAAEDEGYKFRYFLSRLFNSILTEKLRKTSDRARLYEDLVTRSEAAEFERHSLQEQITGYLRELSLFTHLVNSAGDAILVVDTDGRVLTANPALQKAFSIDPQNVTGVPLAKLMGLAAKGERSWLAVARAAQGGGWSGEVLVRHGRRRGVAADCSVSVVDHPASGHMAYSVILRNIAERKRQEAKIHRQQQQLKQAFEALKALDRAKTRFLTLVSHQLRTPITAIIAYAETLATEGMVEPAEQGEFIKVIHQEADRLGEMVNKVLAISKLESGQMHLQFEPHSLQETLNAQVAMLRSRAEAKGLSLILEEHPPYRPVVCDEEQIAESVRQIVDNAIRYSDTGEVRVTYSQDQTHSLIRIADTGKGIEGRNVQKLLETFSRGDEIDASGYGLGLGLPLSYMIVKAHSGRLEVEGNPGQGTTVTLSIPFVPAEVDVRD